MRSTFEWKETIESFVAILLGGKCYHFGKNMLTASQKDIDSEINENCDIYEEVLVYVKREINWIGQTVVADLQKYFR